MKHVVALSGGKDSTAMAIRLRELSDHDFEYVCTPTGDELPEMVAHYRRLEDLLSCEIKRLPNKSLKQLIEEWQMLPNHRARWCTRVIKIEPFIDYMEALPERSVMYVGLRADESGRLGLVQSDANFTTVCPMQHWGWNEQHVLEYLENKKVVIPKRTDCARCFWNTLPEWYSLWLNHQEIFNDASAQEQKIGHTFRSPQRDTWPASLRELAEEFKKGRVPKPRKKKVNNDKCRFCSM